MADVIMNYTENYTQHMYMKDLNEYRLCYLMFSSACGGKTAFIVQR